MNLIEWICYIYNIFINSGYSVGIYQRVDLMYFVQRVYCSFLGENSIFVKTL